MSEYEMLVVQLQQEYEQCVEEARTIIEMVGFDEITNYFNEVEAKLSPDDVLGISYAILARLGKLQAILSKISLMELEDEE